MQPAAQNLSHLLEGALLDRWGSDVVVGHRQGCLGHLRRRQGVDILLAVLVQGRHRGRQGLFVLGQEMPGLLESEEVAGGAQLHEVRVFLGGDEACLGQSDQQQAGVLAQLVDQLDKDLHLPKGKQLGHAERSLMPFRIRSERGDVNPFECVEQPVQISWTCEGQLFAEQRLELQEGLLQPAFLVQEMQFGQHADNGCHLRHPVLGEHGALNLSERIIGEVGLTHQGQLGEHILSAVLLAAQLEYFVDELAPEHVVQLLRHCLPPVFEEGPDRLLDLGVSLGDLPRLQEAHELQLALLAHGVQEGQHLLGRPGQQFGLGTREGVLRGVGHVLGQGGQAVVADLLELAGHATDGSDMESQGFQPFELMLLALADGLGRVCLVGLFGVEERAEGGGGQPDYRPHFQFGMDVDAMIEQVRARKILTERDFKQVIKGCIEIMSEESNLQPVNTPATICGDIHGQFYDLLHLFTIGGEVPSTRYVFLGDYVDRGNNSVQTLQLLLLLKLKHPGHVVLLRGNHETRQISMSYGFYEEARKKYGNTNAWKLSMELFDYMPVAALVGGQVYCIHGGLSPDIRLIEQVRLLDRVQEVPIKGPLCDLMWSDPQEIQYWASNERGAGWLFGDLITKQFSRLNDLKLICRAHQLAVEGYQYWFKQTLVTIWSAPNYCKKCGNSATVMKVDQHLENSFLKFEQADEPADNKPFKSLIPYFL